MLASCEFPKIPSDFEIALFLTFLGQWEVPRTSGNFLGDWGPKMLTSWEISEILLDFDIILFSTFLDQWESWNFQELPYELPRMLASCELPG